MSKVSLMTSEQLINISPDNLDEVVGKATCSIVVFQNYLYLVASCEAGEKSPASSKILRYDPKINSWEEVYRDPQRVGNAAIAFLEETPSLIISFLSPSSSQLLRSEDGKTFHTLPQPQLDNHVLSFRRLLPFQNRLYAIPTDDKAKNVICACDDPATGKWQVVNLPGFDNLDNQAISQIMAFNNCLYAGTVNPETGCQIWKIQDTEQTPYTWKKIISDGARGYTFNSCVSSMVVFHGNLYFATGMPADGYGRGNDIPITAPEIIRIYPDDSWDLIVGTPKFTPDGLKVPLSVMGAGFDDSHNCTLQFMTVHNDCLYVGTQGKGGFQIWATEDGEIWEPIRLEPLSDRRDIKIYTVVTTPLGLVTVLGKTNLQNTDNPSKPKTQDLEVWLGK
ncbi:hypothetical protein H6F61_12055 [Cyanobacteria bacterium FACHB-472]|nr:hypothetical protein [Cyanobacteria bacterium FACHB-472]